MIQPLESYLITCPYCSEVMEILLDCSASGNSYTEDCQVCCQPISVSIVLDDQQHWQVQAHRENE